MILIDVGMRVRIFRIATNLFLAFIFLSKIDLPKGAMVFVKLSGLLGEIDELTVWEDISITIFLTIG